MQAQFSKLCVDATVHGETMRASRVARRLDSIARSDLAECLEGDLHAHLGHGEEVYLLRRIEHRWVGYFRPDENEKDFARAWSRAIVSAVSQRLGQSLGPDDMVRFANATELFARFLIHEAQLARRPSATLPEPWWVTSLRKRLAPHAKPGTGCYEALLGAGEAASPILCNLAESEQLGSVIAALDDTQCRQLWNRGLGGSWPRSRRRAPATEFDDFAGLQRAAGRAVADDAAEPRPNWPGRSFPASGFWTDRHELSVSLALPFRAACAIVDRLDISPVSSAPKRLAKERHEAADDQSELLKRFVADWSGILDWSDRSSLTDAVAAAFLFLFRRGRIFGTPQGLADLVGRQQPSLTECGFDWLDLPRLAHGIAHAQPSPSNARLATEDERALLARPRHVAIGPGIGQATPQQGEILGALNGLLSEARGIGTPFDGALPRTCLSLYGELLSQRPEFIGLSIVPTLIGLIVEAVDETLPEQHESNGVSDSVKDEGPFSVPRTVVNSDETARGAAGSPKTAAGEAGRAPARHASPGDRIGAASEIVKGLGPEAERTVALLRRAVSATAASSAALILRSSEWLPTPNAGLFRLFRAILDSRIYASAKRQTYPGPDAAAAPARLLHAVAMTMAPHFYADPALSLFGNTAAPPSADDTLALWASVADSEHISFQAELTDLAVMQRLAPAEPLHVWRLATVEGPDLLAAGSGESGVALMGRALEREADTGKLIAELAAAWRQCTEAPGTDIYLDEALLPLAAGLPGWTPRAPNSVHEQARRASAATLAEMGPPAAIGAAAGVTLRAAAALIVTAWARWLKGLSKASPSYLLANLLRQPGRVRLLPGRKLEVEIARGPLDVVLDISGYNEPIESIPWLGGIGISFVTTPAGR